MRRLCRAFRQSRYRVVWLAAGLVLIAHTAAADEEIKIVVGFEGSCPHSLEGVRREGPTRFRIFPSWREVPGKGEDAIGRSTRLGIKVANASSEPRQVELHIDWQFHQAPATGVPTFKGGVEEYMSYRDFVVVRGPGDKDWRTVMADTDDSVGTVRLLVAPGETEVHWHPPYTYTQGEDFVESLRGNPLVKMEKLGPSDDGRNMWLLRISDDSPRKKKPALMYARCHAYESAGSYTMEGMVRWLLSGEPYALRAVREYEFYVIPMINPDGVFRGMAKFSALDGVDPQYMFPITSNVQRNMKGVMDRVKPVLHVDLHNWQSKLFDGALFFEQEPLDRFLQYMPDQIEFGKKWRHREPFPIPPKNEFAIVYCRDTYHPTTVSFEFSWFGRTANDMRGCGRKALFALLRALDEPNELGHR